MNDDWRNAKATDSERNHHSSIPPFVMAMQSLKDVGGLIGRLIRAGATDLEGAEPDQISVLIFEVGDRLFAINVENTEGVVYCSRVSPLPGAPDGIVGITSVRGRITVAADLNTGAAARKDRLRLILLKGESQLGLIADRFDTVASFNPDSLRREVPAAISAELRETLSDAGLFEVGSIQHEGREVPVIEMIDER